ncbi:hypothetical protein JDM1_2631 [Lactiplantibacillus plantarum JDM1]|nr:hypothetical protein JDM1_2631 [Lactiplantibacillus plantarum JDM1]
MIQDLPVIAITSFDTSNNQQTQ